jgi:hypothetical protein
MRIYIRHDELRSQCLLTLKFQRLESLIPPRLHRNLFQCSAYRKYKERE